MKTGRDRRKYLRLNSIFPVEIFLDHDHKTNKADVIQGYTHDVSMGGICITINNASESFISIIKDDKAEFDLSIGMLMAKKPIETRAKVMWHETEDHHRYKKLRLGVTFERIKPEDRKRIMNSARKMVWMPKIGAFFVIALFLVLGLFQYNNTLLVKKNKTLIEKLHKTQFVENQLEKDIGSIDREHSMLLAELDKKQKMIEDLNLKISYLKDARAQDEVMQKNALANKINKIEGEKAEILSKVEGLKSKREKASKEALAFQAQRNKLEKEAVQNMYRWIEVHQNRITGLVSSFEGDKNLKNWAFTYDQSLACQAFLIFKDYKRASKVLDFYKNTARADKKAFFNAYNTITGKPQESMITAGPNIWIAISACQYTYFTGDKRYLVTAEDIARWLKTIQDKEGGIKGGPGLTWYSTEHNLDAYALFNMLYELTKKTSYKKESERVLKWIKSNTYSKSSGSMKRGKGDATIATDTMAWAIAAIGPEGLERQDMDPDQIIKFAEENCLVEATFERPSGKSVRINGFDFGKEKNIARGGIVSSEWTAQMVISFQMMSDYYKKTGDQKKTTLYDDKADYYLFQLFKMIISSPSRSGQGAGCLPYATQGFADTGHGWRTPKGAQTGSVAGTAYTIFAKKHFNPLSLKQE